MSEVEDITESIVSRVVKNLIKGVLGKNSERFNFILGLPFIN